MWGKPPSAVRRAEPGRLLYTAGMIPKEAAHPPIFNFFVISNRRQPVRNLLIAGGDDAAG